MLRIVRALAAASIAALCTACEEQKTPRPVAQTADAPMSSGATASASTCALRPVTYTHGTLKDRFLIGGDASDPLRRQAVFAKRRLQVNTDGAENSYHSDKINADDASVGAINIICNAGVKIYPRSLLNYFREPEPVKCYRDNGISVEPRYAELYSAIKANDWKPALGHRIEFNWDILGKKESDASWFQRLFEWDRPCVNERGFFVSKTKLTNYTPKQQCDQKAYLDANVEKAVVLPQHWLADWQAPDVPRWASFLPGDVVVAYRPAEGGEPETWVYGIVGDAGPLLKYGEATPAFNWQLLRKSGSMRDEIRTYRQALGLDTDTLKPAQVPFVVLERTAPALGGDYSAANVEAKAKTEFAKWGGEARFKACLELMQ